MLCGLSKPVLASPRGRVASRCALKFAFSAERSPERRFDVDELRTMKKEVTP
jgi:hypothetical protein